MKRVLFAAALLLIITTSQAQNYIPFPTSAVWRITSWSLAGAFDNSFAIWGDTVIASTTLSKLYSQSNVDTVRIDAATYVGAIGSIQNGDYVVYIGKSVKTVTDIMNYVLYDFTLVDGSTNTLVDGWCSSTDWIVYSEGAVTYNDSISRKRIDLTAQWLAGSDTWVEGIGSMQHFLYPLSYCGYDWGAQLQCFSVDNSIVYGNNCALGLVSSFKISSNPACKNDSIIFTPRSINATNFRWKIDGSDVSTDSILVTAFDAAGDYTINLVVDDGKIQSSTSVVLTVYDTLPTANYDSKTSVNPVEFTDLSVDGLDYFWSFGDGDTSIEQHPLHSFTDTGDFNVCLYATNPCGTDSICNIVNKCVLSYFTPDDGYICKGYLTSFTNYSIGKNLSYQWLINDSLIDTSMNLSYTFPEATDHIVTLVVNGNSCTDTFNMVVTIEPMKLFIVDIQKTTCSVACDGSARVSISCGIAPFTYLWDNGDTSATSSANCYGTNSVRVIDAAGDTATKSFYTSYSYYFYSLVYTTQSISCYGDSNGVLKVVPSNGVAPYQYAWSTGDTSETISGLLPGNYISTITDANGCYHLRTTTLKEPDTISIIYGIVNPNYCGMNIGSISVTTSGGTQPYTYSWSSGDTISTANNLSDGSYTVIIIDANDCFFTKAITVEIDSLDSVYVWPGDANADKIVNIQDVFSIGLAYNDTGPARDSISITWDRKCAFAWINFYASGANHAHGDCNGDGKINSDDIGAISANYGLTHTKNSSSVQYNVSTPDLYMTFSNDSLNPQDTFTATVHLGTDSAQSTSIYGIAFTLTYDDLLIESGSVIPGFSPSWIGNIADTSLISFSKIQTSNLVMVQVRTDRKNSIGFGEISQVSFEITANPGNSQALNFSFSDIHAIDSAGNPINITDTISNSVYISETTGILDYMSVSDVIKIFPNPTTGIVTVKSLSKRDEVFNISVFDILGNLILYVQHNPIQQDQSTIDLSNYRSGIYSIRIATSISAFSKKVVLTR